MQVDAMVKSSKERNSLTHLEIQKYPDDHDTRGKDEEDLINIV